MITVTTNIKVIIQAKLEQIQELRNNPDKVLRTVALAVLPEMKYRVHVDGKDSSGGQIGTYSPSYMTLRTGNYKDAAKVKKRDFTEKKVAGEAGKYTKGVNTKIFGTVVEETSKVGEDRRVYNRTADTKVILSLNRQMENDMTVVPSGNGYGIGYLNPDNFKKAIFCEATYDKKILTKLTKEERDLGTRTAQEFTAQYLKNNDLTPESYLGIK